MGNCILRNHSKYEKSTSSAKKCFHFPKSTGRFLGKNSNLSTHINIWFSTPTPESHSKGNHLLNFKHEKLYTSYENWQRYQNNITSLVFLVDRTQKRLD